MYVGLKYCQTKVSRLPRMSFLVLVIFPLCLQGFEEVFHHPHFYVAAPDCPESSVQEVFITES
jgi:hypothetical protein